MLDARVEPPFRTGRDRPAILIVAGDNRDAALAQTAIDAIGGRTIGPVTPVALAAKLEHVVSLDAVIVEAATLTPDAVDAIFEVAGGLSSGPRLPKLIATPLDRIDVFANRLADRDITLLCDADAADRAVALQITLADPGPYFHDRATEFESERLRRLADEVSRIARTLSTLSAQAPATPDYRAGVADMALGFRAQPAEAAHAAALPDATELRAMIRLRRLRDQFFPPDLFADPAWDILLDLMAARLEQVQVAVSSLCIAAAVPPTTALRWIAKMTEEGLLERVADPSDGRRIFIRLTDASASGLARYFDAAGRLRSLTA
jgi:DNA-binding MarR family transcriptional regulator